MLVVPLFKKRVRRVCPNYTCFLNLSHDCSLPLWCHFQSTATGKMVITWDGQKKQKPGVFYMLNSHFTSATLIRLPCLDERGWAAVEHIIAKTFLLFTSPFSFFIQCVCYIYNIKTKHNSVFPRHHPPPRQLFSVYIALPSVILFLTLLPPSPLCPFLPLAPISLPPCLSFLLPAHSIVHPTDSLGLICTSQADSKQY